MLLPVRGEGESPEAYAARRKEFRTRVPRRWDQGKRLALAHEYYVRQECGTRNAADLVLIEALPEALRIAAEEKARLAGVKILKAIKAHIGNSGRGRRTKRKRAGFSKFDRRVETIRAEAMRFKRKHPNFRQLYETALGGWRAQFSRDPEWYAEAAPVYKTRIEEAELSWKIDNGIRLRKAEIRRCTQLGVNMRPARLRTSKADVARAVVDLAELYLEQVKVAQAHPLYRQALAVTEEALGPEHAYTVWISDRLKLCECIGAQNAKAGYPWGLPVESKVQSEPPSA